MSDMNKYMGFEASKIIARALIEKEKIRAATTIAVSQPNQASGVRWIAVDFLKQALSPSKGGNHAEQ